MAKLMKLKDEIGLLNELKYYEKAKKKVQRRIDMLKKKLRKADL